MICSNCGSEMAEGLMFCTNCGTPLAVGRSADALDDVAGDVVAVDEGNEIGASLEAAIKENQQVMEPIEERTQSVIDAAQQAAHDAEMAVAQAAEPVAAPIPQQFDMNAPEAPTGYVPPSYGQPAQTVDSSFNAADTASSVGAAGAAGVAAGIGAATVAGAADATNGFGGQQATGASSAPFYQQDVSPNAHYSSQRSYDQNPYGQNVGQAAYQQPSYGQPPYEQPSYSQPQQQQVWEPQSDTKRAYAMVLYFAGLIGIIIALVVRDKNDQFITHHLNNCLVIFIGAIISSILSAILIGIVLGIYLFVMFIMGVVSAYHGDMNELPLIGKIHIVQ